MLAKGEYQSHICHLTHRYREQARSHRKSVLHAGLMANHDSNCGSGPEYIQGNQFQSKIGFPIETYNAMPPKVSVAGQLP